MDLASNVCIENSLPQESDNESIAQQTMSVMDHWYFDFVCQCICVCVCEYALFCHTHTRMHTYMHNMCGMTNNCQLFAVVVDVAVAVAFYTMAMWSLSSSLLFKE